MSYKRAWLYTCMVQEISAVRANGSYVPSTLYLVHITIETDFSELYICSLGYRACHQ